MWMKTSAPTHVSEGTRIQGSVTLVAAAAIHGLVEGDILQQSVELLQVGRSGWIHGCIESLGPVLIEGRVEGDILCRSRIQVSATAVICGAISAPSVTVALGAQVNGDFRVARRGAQAVTA